MVTGAVTGGEDSFMVLKQKQIDQTTKNAKSTNNCYSFMSLPPYLRSEPNGVLLSIKLQPRASANEIGEVMGNELRVKVTAPPVDSAANEALVRFLAETLDCGRNKVELLRGQTSRHKTIRVHGMTAEEVLKRIEG
jgi:uncharacterized protein (TIGR00251 family)